MVLPIFQLFLVNAGVSAALAAGISWLSKEASMKDVVRVALFVKSQHTVGDRWLCMCDVCKAAKAILKENGISR